MKALSAKDPAFKQDTDKMAQELSKREVFEEWCAQSVTMIVGRLQGGEMRMKVVMTLL
jgi:hypothetical protein